MTQEATSAYERELIGLTKVISHWHSYFWGNSFVVCTNHYSLKYLLEQRILPSSQQHWINKLLGYDFQVAYRPWKLNVVADALSRQEEYVSSLFSISSPHWDFCKKFAMNTCLPLLFSNVCSAFPFPTRRMLGLSTKATFS